MPVLYIRDKNGNFIPIPSIKGADGKSAYEQAKDGGYTGTEEEFISILNGTAGDGAHFNNYSNPHKVTAAQAGAIPITNAKSAQFDMDAIFTSGAHFAYYDTNVNTLGTPYKHGVTDLTAAVILSYSNGGYGYQIAFMAASIPYMRTLHPSHGISDWTRGYLPIAGGTMTGSLTVNTKGNWGQIAVKSQSGYYRAFEADDGRIRLDVRNNDKSSDRRFLDIANSTGGALKDALLLYDIINGVGKNYKVYGDHNAVDVGISKIKVGTYEGTGTSGTSSNWLANPTVISCDFEPHFVCIYGDGTSGNVGYGFAIKGCSFIGYNETRNIFNAQCNWGSNFIEIGGISADKQANTSGKQYTYFIAGK